MPRPSGNSSANGKPAARSGPPLWEAAPRDRIAPQLEALAVPIESLTPDPDNARLHGDRNMFAIKDSLSLYGQLKPVVVREQNGVVMAGNGTLRAAAELGWTVLAASVVAMTDEEAVGYALADNRTAELAEWDYEVVARLTRLQEEIGAAMVGWSVEELAHLRSTEFKPQTDPDSIPEPPKISVVVSGDMWILGDHKLACGDSTNSETVRSLFGKEKPFIMVTDPPYGVDYDPKWRDNYGPSSSFVRLTGTVPNDALPPNSFRGQRARGEVLNDSQVDWSAAYKLFPGNVVYCWHAGVHAADVARSLTESGYSIRSQIIWVKQHFVFGRGAYHWKHEPCWYAVRDGSTADWTGDRKQSTVWDIQNHNPMGGKRKEGLLIHGTQKPVECMAIPIRHHGNPTSIVYDPFVGVGTTIIAAQQLGRRCFAIDIDPFYCSVTLQRFLDFTGIDPVRDSDGVKFSELKKQAGV